MIVNVANGAVHWIKKCSINFEILSCFADQGSGFCVTGKIEAGYIQTGDRLLAMPPNETCTAKGILLQDHFVKLLFC